jgi:hypothetical protein
LRSLQEIQPDFVEEGRPKLGCGAKERRRRKLKFSTNIKITSSCPQY